MKLLSCIVITLFLSACAPEQHQSTAWTMSWSRNSNANCHAGIGAWSGNGSFSNESDCLAWETYFLNINYGLPHQSVSSCTGN